jgi:hypothetical protein
MSRDIQCAGCGSSISDESSPCPICGDVRKSISLSVTTTMSFMEELGLQARDAEDRLRRDYQSRTDGIKEGFVDRDLTGPEEVIRRSGTRSGPLVNFDEETKYVEAFISSLNFHTGRSYEIEPKEQEDSDFPDRWLIERTPPNEPADRRVGVEVTHLDQESIAGLNRDERFDISGSMEAIIASTTEAIDKKRRKIEPRVASRTILLLVCPYPLPPTLQAEFRALFLATSPAPYFNQVWGASFREPAFRLV